MTHTALAPNPSPEPSRFSFTTLTFARLLGWAVQPLLWPPLAVLVWLGDESVQDAVDNGMGVVS